MKSGRGMISEQCHAVEGPSGPASLRMPGSIMALAPSGRLFGAIATLSDVPAPAIAAQSAGRKVKTARPRPALKRQA